MSRYIDADAFLKEYCEPYPHVYKAMSRAMADAPSIDIEPKRGEWVEDEEDWRHQIVFWRCSECGYAVSTMYNFCPNCGARMKGADDE